MNKKKQLFRKIGKVVAMTGLTKEEERKSEILNKGIIWSESEKYDSGVTPCIAVNRPGVIVEVHQSSFFSTLYYCVGGINLIDLKVFYFFFLFFFFCCVVLWVLSFVYFVKIKKYKNKNKNKNKIKKQK